MKLLLRVAVSLSIGVVVTMALPSYAESAPHNRLTLGSVAPSVGTTSTDFVFSVTFSGAAGNTASSVVAHVAGLAVPLALVPPGTPDKGTWRGSSRLAAGSWPVSFEATATGITPTLDLAQPVVVTAPGPTPQPTVAPTAAPTATPAPTFTVGSTPGPAAGGSGASASDPPPFGTTFADPSDSPTARETATSTSPGIASQPPPSPAGLPVEGIAAIGLLAVVAVAAVSAERRRRQAAAGVAGDSAWSEPPPPHDEDHLATIDYVPPPEAPEAPEEPSAERRDAPADEASAAPDAASDEAPADHADAPPDEPRG